MGRLSTDERRKLKASTFCGPKRSFPVPDCDHVTAARRLIGRYKGEGDKDKILACVAKKAKSLNCDTKKAGSPLQQKAPTRSKEKKEYLKSEEFKETKENNPELAKFQKKKRTKAERKKISEFRKSHPEV